MIPSISLALKVDYQQWRNCSLHQLWAPNRWFGAQGVFNEIFDVWERWISMIGGAGTAFPCRNCVPLRPVQWHFNHWISWTS